jgi:hypothetical protein
MEKSSKRGKIPQLDWPSIISRYEAGETLASIARTYDCSPPAISYIVSRTRARNAATGKTEPQAAVEPQLIKAVAPPTKTSEPPTTPDMTAHESMHSSDTPNTATRPDTGPLQSSVREPTADPPRSGGNGWHDQGSATLPARRESDANDRRGSDHETPRERYHQETAGPSAHAPVAAGGSQPGEPRRTLHLSHPHGNGGNDMQAGHGGQHWAGPAPAAEIRPIPRSGPASNGLAAAPRQTPPPVATPPGAPSPSALAAMRGAGVTAENALKSRDGVFIDHALRERISEDITAFLAAFDAALDHDSAETRTALREATDRLLRAGARTRIELERLEARIPLPSRESAARSQPAFRSR